MTKRYLLRFAQDSSKQLLAFRQAEADSIISSLNLNLKLTPFSEDLWEAVCNSDDVVKKFLSRTILVRNAIEIWADAPCRISLLECLKDISDEKLDVIRKSSGFKVLVSTLRKTITMKEKVGFIEDMLQALPEFQTPVNLSNPEHVLCLVEEYENIREGNLMHAYFGIHVGDGQRHLLHTYDIKNRFFIGNTTMDPELSLLMSNIGQVKPNDVVFDPFVGTGGILTLCAHHGAYVCGADLDYKIIHALSKPSKMRDKETGRHKDESIRSNFRQYGFEHRYLDVIVNDASVDVFHNEVQFDCIITDPPYGVREGAKTLKNGETGKHTSEMTSLPEKEQLSLGEMFSALTDFAVQRLKVDGRLVFWMPSVSDNIFTEAHVPKHVCMEVEYVIHYPITHTASRNLIVLKKVRENEADDRCYLSEDYYDFGDIRFRDRYLNAVCGDS